MLQYLVICLIVLPVPVVLMIRQIRFLFRARRCTEAVEGTVVRLEERIAFGRRHRSDFVPEVAYTYENERYYGLTFQRFTYDTYAVNMPVTVYVDPDDPEHFVLEREKSTAKTGILMYALCLFFLAIVLGAVNVQITEDRERRETHEAMLDELEERLLSGEEDALEDFAEENFERYAVGSYNGESYEIPVS